MNLKHPAIAVDIGGTRIKIALIDDEKVIKRSIIPAYSEISFADRLPDLEREIHSLLELAGSPVPCIGIALPCLVDPIRKRATEIYSKFEDLPEINLEKWCREKFGFPVVVEQDSKAALLGEVHYGCAKGFDNVVMVIMGTGVGTAVMLDGHLLNGKHFSAGSLGSHIVVEMKNGRKCTCPGSGCLEAYTSGWALPQLVREHSHFAESPLSSCKIIDFRALEAAVRKKDVTACDVLQTIITAMRAGIISFIHAYDPEAVILSGGPLNMGTLFTDPLLDGIDRLLWGKGRKISFLRAQNPDDSVLLGMYYLTCTAQEEFRK